ncbi:hypothetical protein [Paenibacillus popilliae]|uniref:hypothetical protein n=1 Tax=Paenibacillus popilliae TaxID=78057 RepID=UPI00131F1E37|nr:hypothetical protein [Paenibacillus popilliae]
MSRIQDRLSHLPIRVPVAKFTVTANPRHGVVLAGAEQSQVYGQIGSTIEVSGLWFLGSSWSEPRQRWRKGRWA